MDKNKQNKDITFYSLPEEKQDEIIKKAIRGANRDQRKLEREFEKKYGRLEATA